MLEIRNVGNCFLSESWQQAMLRHLYSRDVTSYISQEQIFSKEEVLIDSVKRALSALPMVIDKSENEIFFLSQDGFTSLTSSERVDATGKFFTYYFQMVGTLEYLNKFKAFCDNISRHQFVPIRATAPAGHVKILSKNEFGQLYFRMIEKPAFSKLVRSNYSEEVLSSFDYIVSEIIKEEPSGRISILQGKPGTGKTYMVRAMLGEFKDKNVILISPDMINSLNDPALAELLFNNVEQGLPFIFLIEDADSCLAPRDGQNENVISKVLNMSDGILGSLMDVRIVATTNVKIDVFDEAIVRPGRLMKLVNVDALSFEKANARYKELGGKDELEEKEYTIAEIYKKVYEESLEEKVA